jgi:hypothetical protein
VELWCNFWEKPNRTKTKPHARENKTHPVNLIAHPHPFCPK